MVYRLSVAWEVVLSVFVEILNMVDLCLPSAPDIYFATESAAAVFLVLVFGALFHLSPLELLPPFLFTHHLHFRTLQLLLLYFLRMQLFEDLGDQ